MKEILGQDLEQFFNNGVNGKRTYKGNWYEVWEVSDEVFNDMCDMSEEKFIELAGDDAWWRSAEGSVLGTPDTRIYIHGYEMLGWGYNKDFYDEDDEEYESEMEFDTLTDYLCDVLGASQPRNVCALAVDLAKYNNITMGELFAKYEG